MSHREAEDRTDQAALVVSRQLGHGRLQHRRQLGYHAGVHRHQRLVDLVVDFRMVLVLQQQRKQTARSLRARADADAFGPTGALTTSMPSTAHSLKLWFLASSITFTMAHISAGMM